MKQRGAASVTVVFLVPLSHGIFLTYCTLPVVDGNVCEDWDCLALSSRQMPGKKCIDAFISVVELKYLNLRLSREVS